MAQDVIYELVAKIEADVSSLKKALAQSEKDINSFGKDLNKKTEDWKKSFKEAGKAMAVAGAAITASMGLMIKSFASAGSELHDLSLITGISVKALAGLKYAAEQNGASLGNIQIAIRTLANTLNDASDGLETAERSFKKLNISVKDLKSLTPEQQFLKVASAVAEISDPMERSAAASDMFGTRLGTQLIPMLSQGADGLKKMMEEGVKLSGWTEEGANQADALGDSFTKLKTSMTGAFNVAASSLAPIIINLADKISDIISKVRDWTNQHPELTKLMSTFSITLGIVLTTMGGLLMAIPKIISAFISIKTVIIGANASMVAFGATLIGLTAGLGMITYGLSLLSSESEKVERSQARRKALNEELEKYNKGLKNDAAEMLQAYLDELDAKRKFGYATEREIQWLKESGEQWRNAIKIIRDYEKAQEEAADANKKVEISLEWLTKAIQKASDREIKLAQKTHDYKMGLLDAEYETQLRNLGLTENEEIKALQDKIDALNQKTQEEQDIIDEGNFQKEKSNLEYIIKTTEDEKELTRTREQLAELEARHTRDLLLKKREQEISALRDDIDRVRKSYQTKREELQSWYEIEQKTLNDSLENELERIEKATEAIEIAYKIREEETAEHIKALNEITAQLQNRIIKIAFETGGISGIPDFSPPGKSGDKSSSVEDIAAPPPGSTPPGTPGSIYTPGYGLYANGGIVSRPTLAMVGEGGEKEAIIPEHDWGNLGGVNITFTDLVVLDREDRMNELVSKIYQKIQTRQRINYGSPYKG